MFIKEHYCKGGTLYIKCSKCGEFKIKEDFPKDRTKSNGIRSCCKKCYRQSIDRDYCKRYLKQYGELHNKEKNGKRKRRLRNMKDKHGENPRNLHERARLYIDKNNLRPKECMVCGLEGRIEFHHPSYEDINKWKEGVFVCVSCHRLIHSGELDCPEALDLVQLNAHMPKILTKKDIKALSKPCDSWTDFGKVFEFLANEPDLYEDIEKDAEQ